MKNILDYLEARCKDFWQLPFVLKILGILMAPPMLVVLIFGALVELYCILAIFAAPVWIVMVIASTIFGSVIPAYHSIMIASGACCIAIVCIVVPAIYWDLRRNELPKARHH